MRSNSPRPGAGQTVPFRDVEEAWFWTVNALRARHDGTRRRDGARGLPRPCEPDDVVKCLDQLYRQHLLGLAHARALRRWGERGVPPDGGGAGGMPARGAQREEGDALLWREAMVRLAPSLRRKGIVA